MFEPSRELIAVNASDNGLAQSWKKFFSCRYVDNFEKSVYGSFEWTRDGRALCALNDESLGNEGTPIMTACFGSSLNS